MHGLNELERQMKDCGSCDLCKERTQVIFGEGSTNPLIMIVGEAPNAEEDAQGATFIGKIGDKLDNMLKYIGVTRDDIYITNSVLCSTPNDRKPRGEELEACKWRLDLQIKLLKPKLVILLGKIAMQQMQAGTVKGPLTQFFTENITSKNGWLSYQVGDHQAKVLVTYHPSYHLHSPERAYNKTLSHWTKIKQWIEHERQAI